MILADLKAHIECHPGVTRQALAAEFALSEDGIEAMLAVWIRKGKLSRTEDCDKAGQLIRVRYHVNQPNSLSIQVTM
ncbi:FeoC-like transcriptional regulator [Vibrio sp. ZSDZ65]|uniref:FeoC-like transcriptional regulator n=1 Tax=Vibrio qingdaonensis TaxID=2829491 RepID=A0A9X3HXB9_9VIBR|nr:FeoC-like transcriptional regulator [Vibrio qingdaonensis]MCW8347331.1 FeoC-like transcriptional regulator [Vibrio qingdaonensis]